ncbi:hypothetical protein BC831DRAFT_457808 [Entophlyctis helioformis]|nr:hypothetical protein BC831DRAFT_457808 [Entophlyctis helioformis]
MTLPSVPALYGGGSSSSSGMAARTTTTATTTMVATATTAKMGGPIDAGSAGSDRSYALDGMGSSPSRSRSMPMSAGSASPDTQRLGAYASTGLVQPVAPAASKKPSVIASVGVGAGAGSKSTIPVVVPAMYERTETDVHARSGAHPNGDSKNHSNDTSSDSSDKDSSAPDPHRAWFMILFMVLVFGGLHALPGASMLPRLLDRLGGSLLSTLATTFVSFVTGAVLATHRLRLVGGYMRLQGHRLFRDLQRCAWLAVIGWVLGPVLLPRVFMGLHWVVWRIAGLGPLLVFWGLCWIGLLCGLCGLWVAGTVCWDMTRVLHAGLRVLVLGEAAGRGKGKSQGKGKEKSQGRRVRLDDDGVESDLDLGLVSDERRRRRQRRLGHGRRSSGRRGDDHDDHDGHGGDGSDSGNEMQYGRIVLRMTESGNLRRQDATAVMRPKGLARAAVDGGGDADGKGGRSKGAAKGGDAMVGRRKGPTFGTIPPPTPVGDDGPSETATRFSFLFGK